MGELARSIDRLSEQCWDVAGVNRSTKGMQTLLKLTTNAMAPLEQEELLCIVNRQQHEQQLALEEPSRQELNLLLDLVHRQRTSALLLEACLFRAESRGGHFRIDAPSTLPQWQRHSRQIRDQRIHTRQVND
jgi:L-aspartate oxidase